MLLRALRLRTGSLARWSPAASCVQPQQSAQRPWTKLEAPDAYTPLIDAACQAAQAQAGTPRQFSLQLQPEITTW